MQASGVTASAVRGCFPASNLDITSPLPSDSCTSCLSAPAEKRAPAADAHASAEMSLQIVIYDDARTACWDLID